MTPPYRARWLLVGPACVAAVGLFMVIYSLQLKDPSPSIFGARFWPFTIGALLFVVNVFTVFRIALSPISEDDIVDPRVATTSLSTLIPAALIVSMPVLVYFGGFLVGSATFLLAFMGSMGYRNWVVIPLTSISFSLIITYFFSVVAYTPLPKGVGPFYELSVGFLRLVSGS